jgi:hypothetical protein
MPGRFSGLRRTGYPRIGGMEVGRTDASGGRDAAAAVSEPRYRGLLDVLLFLCALPSARRAQRVVDTPLPAMVARMTRCCPHLPADPERVARAAARATSRWARLAGGLDSCLTRSLVIGGMLANRGETMLNIGFRPGDGRRAVDGHAWVTVDGRPVGPDGTLAAEDYSRTLEIPFLPEEVEMEEETL